MTTVTGQTMSIEPTGGALGATVSGFDARKATPEEVLQLKQALRENHILIFNNQQLKQDEFIAFATLFGPLFVPPRDVPVLGSSAGTPSVLTVANTEGGYLGNRDVLPHSDHHWTPYPSSGSLLYALETPSQGGETSWINLVQAYEELDADSKAEIADLRMITYNPFYGQSDENGVSNRDNQPEHLRFAHPLVRTHPESGRKILYLSGDYEVEIVGLSPEASDKLAARLRAHLLQPCFAYEHRWSVGDIVFWDNQATLHFRRAFDPSHRRVMKRVSLAGGRPF